MPLPSSFDSKFLSCNHHASRQILTRVLQDDEWIGDVTVTLDRQDGDEIGNMAMLTHGWTTEFQVSSY